MNLGVDTLVANTFASLSIHSKAMKPSLDPAEGIALALRGLALGVDCECAAAAVVGARLGLRVGALLFVTDNVTLPHESDRRYRGLSDPRVRAAFEAGADLAVEVLARIEIDSPRRGTATT